VGLSVRQGAAANAQALRVKAAFPERYSSGSLGTDTVSVDKNIA
jgi:hypothetical protein